MNIINEFKLENYQQERPFASFLSGISGKKGIPMWAFYVNRGQGMASFGLRDKNGAIMEFFPANAIYRHIARLGFRTFIKVQGKVEEFFLENHPGQTMIIRPDQFSVIEENKDLGLRIKVTYFTLPNEFLAGLVRRVEITNLTENPMDLEIVDGLAQVLTSGIDYGGLKAVSNLLQSWMESENNPDYMYFSLRASTGDGAQVHDTVDGNFYLTVSNEKPVYVSDCSVIFGNDTSLTTPHGFVTHSVKELSGLAQTHVNQVPCGFSAFKKNLKKQFSFDTLIGHASDRQEVVELIKIISKDYFSQKEEENQKLHDQLTLPIRTQTAYPILDAYFKQCFLDNVIRGGTPMIVNTLDGTIGYHLFSRKHGDLERDYNFFSIEPAYFSQGNGAFRDVLQNRRNDLFFEPRLGDFNIRQFGSLIQADGYNPLSVEGIKFTFTGDVTKYPEPIASTLKSEFTPGVLFGQLKAAKMDGEKKLEEILAQSHYEIKAAYGEGYWEDHFTYLFDLIETYLALYPDKEETLLFNPDYPFFVSPVVVLPRKEKYVLKEDGSVRQYDAVHHLQGAPSAAWLRSADNQKIRVDLFGKLLTLALNKYAHLDPAGIGLSYEAEKPGWNDAMNGIPGLCGSGVSETIELKKLVQFLRTMAEKYPESEVRLLDSTCKFAKTLATIDEKNAFKAWDKRMDALENYRESLKLPQKPCLGVCSNSLSILKKMDKDLQTALKKAKEVRDIYPTYLTFEAEHYETISENGVIKKAANGLPLVRVTSFKMKPLPAFLEAPARYLSSLSGTVEAQAMYQTIRTLELYDKANRFYQTSESLNAWTNEIGRIRAFTPGWLERESNFLHMTYKYMLGLLKAGLFEEFFDEMKTNLTCFMDPKVYGRSPLENSSFIATSSNPDPKKRGQGFYARLSGSTAEVLSMWRFMFIGRHPFTYENGKLHFWLEPKLPKEMFLDGQVETTLFGSVKIVLHNEGAIDTFAKGVRVGKYIVSSLSKQASVIVASSIEGPLAHAIRNGQVSEIHAYIEGGNDRT